VTSNGVRLRAEILAADGTERVADERLVVDDAGAADMARDMLERCSPAVRRLFEA
jgi:hypothetical protein